MATCNSICVDQRACARGEKIPTAATTNHITRQFSTLRVRGGTGRAVGGIGPPSIVCYIVISQGVTVV